MQKKVLIHLRQISQIFSSALYKVGGVVDE
jgi:hypothetical protein